MTVTLEPGVDPGFSAELIEQVREYADFIGPKFGRNEVMRTFRMGSPRAKALLAAAGLTDASPISAPPSNTYDLSTAEWPLYVPDQRDIPAADPQVGDLGAVPGPAPDPVSVAGPAEVAQHRSRRPKVRRPRSWPLAILALPASVSLWSGWVGLGELTGFGVVHPLPGIDDALTLNTAITLPIGVEAYAAYAIRIWLAARVSTRVRVFAMWSSIAALILGAAGQIAYHLMVADGITHAPNGVTVGVACIPVVVVAVGSALAHMVHKDGQEP